MFIRWVVLLLGIGLLSACAIVPTGPSVLVLPTVGKPLDLFQRSEEHTSELQSLSRISYAVACQIWHRISLCN